MKVFDLLYAIQLLALADYGLKIVTPIFPQAMGTVLFSALRKRSGNHLKCLKNNKKENI